MIEAHGGLSERHRECLGVVVEVARVLAPWSEQLCLVGGWAVYALTELFGREEAATQIQHRGSLDVDVAFGWTAAPSAQAEPLAQALRAAGYDGPERFRWRRAILATGRRYEVDLMLLPPAGHEGGVIQSGGLSWAPLWNGEVAVRAAMPIIIRAPLPDGQPAEALIRIASLAGLIYAKSQIAFAPGPGEVGKYLYDIYVLVRAYPGGPAACASHLRSVLTQAQRVVCADALTVLFEAPTSPGAMAVAQVMGAERADYDRIVTEAMVTMRRLLQGMGLNVT